MGDVVSFPGAKVSSQDAAEIPQKIGLPALVKVPSGSSKDISRLSIARMERAAFVMENAIATLKKESDGGSRVIPMLKEIFKEFQDATATLRKELDKQ
jgi:hypothetical protein